jgi:serine/threonine protein kinase
MKRVQDKHFIQMYHSFCDTDSDGQEVFCIIMEYAEKGDLLSYFIKRSRD